MEANFFTDPFGSGFINFLIGILFILGTYHFLLYFQQKDRSYLLYGAYAFTVMLTLLPSLTQGFLYSLHPDRGFLPLVETFLIEVSYALYFLFAYRFLEMKKNAPRWDSFIRKAIYVFLLFCSIIQLAFLITGDERLSAFSYTFFLVYIPILAILGFIPIFRSSNPLRHYIIAGSLLLFLTSLVPVFMYILFQWVPEGNKVGYTIYFMGLILENLAFSLGLGHKQKLLLRENVDSKKQIILQYEENEKLRQEIQRQLEQNVESLQSQVEADKLEKIRARYDKELAEMKLVSLRSQMNPHFIFNSLNSIKLYIITNERENAVYYLNKFSKLIRRILSATTEKQVSLAEELETMELYVSIENIRFQGEIHFQVERDPELFLEEVKLPGLLLQPFVENAIWHGFPLSKREKILQLQLEKMEGPRVRIRITDNGIGRKRSGELNRQKLHKRKSLGINFTQERLRTFYSNYREPFSLEFEDLTDGEQALGTRVTLVLPME